MNQERTGTGAGVNLDASAAHQLDPTVDGKDPAGGDAIRTIYICNLPVDVQYREIWNLCRFLPGFLRCSVFVNNKMHPSAFAEFSTVEQATHALEELQNRQFDPESSQELRVMWAKKNMSIASRKRAVAAGVEMPLEKRMRHDFAGYPAASYEETMALAAATAAGAGGAPGGAAYPHMHSPHTGGGMSPMPSFQGGAGAGASASTAGRVPCSTLFISHLSERVVEHELSEVVKAIPGYRAFKFNKDRLGNKMAFVDFVDIQASSAALLRLSAVVLPSNDGAPLRVSYAKASMQAVLGPSSGGVGSGGGGVLMPNPAQAVAAAVISGQSVPGVYGGPYGGGAGSAPSSYYGGQGPRYNY